jgi:hypothetical protein
MGSFSSKPQHVWKLTKRVTDEDITVLVRDPRCPYMVINSRQLTTWCGSFWRRMPWDPQVHSQQCREDQMDSFSSGHEGVSYSFVNLLWFLWYNWLSNASPVFLAFTLYVLVRTVFVDWYVIVWFNLELGLTHVPKFTELIIGFCFNFLTSSLEAFRCSYWKQTVKADDEAKLDMLTIYWHRFYI